MAVVLVALLLHLMSLRIILVGEMAKASCKKIDMGTAIGGIVEMNRLLERRGQFYVWGIG